MKAGVIMCLRKKHTLLPVVPALKVATTHWLVLSSACPVLNFSKCVAVFPCSTAELPVRGIAFDALPTGRRLSRARLLVSIGTNFFRFFIAFWRWFAFTSSATTLEVFFKKCAGDIL